MTKKVYRSEAAKKVAERPQKPKPQRESKKVGSGKHAHPQPRTSQG